MHQQGKSLAVAVLLLLAGQACAQAVPGAAERAKLSFLTGSFTTKSTMPPGPGMPQGASGTGTAVLSWTLDSAFIEIHEESMNSLFGKYKGRGFLGFDAPVKKYALSMFNNFGDHPSYAGTFSGDTLVLGATIPSPRGTFEQKILWFKDGDQIRLRVFNDMGSGPGLVVEEILTPKR